jgi:hypothetical protein
MRFTGSLLNVTGIQVNDSAESRIRIDADGGNYMIFTKAEAKRLSIAIAQSDLIDTMRANLGLPEIP